MIYWPAFWPGPCLWGLYCGCKIVALKRAQLVISETGRMSLMTAGITTGWLSVWMQSAGYEDIELYPLESDAWKKADACQLFIASDSELKSVGTCFDGNQNYADAHRIQLQNPLRTVFVYRHKNNALCSLLIPIGDVAYQRATWLFEIAGSRSLRPLNVWIGDDGGAELEPGLRGNVSAAPCSQNVLNSAGILPEEQVLQVLQEKNRQVRFAESCTCGGMAERLSRMPGSSEVLDRGWVTYSNLAKQEMLGIPESSLQKYGAVSREVVEVMASHGSDNGHVCVAVSGIAGPAGGSHVKPVGTIWLAVALPHEKPVSRQYYFAGSRAEIRARSILAGFSMLISALSEGQ